MTFNEQVRFRLFQMPCCGQSLCWVNPRLPNYCPECGRAVYTALRFGGHDAVIDEPALLKQLTKEST